MNNKGYAEERLGGFRGVEITTEKNPTENIVETAVSTDNEIEKIVLENHELNSTAITHKGFAEDSYQQELIRYAYSIGGLEFVKLIECENGQWNPKAVGDNGHAHGLCQMSDLYHKIPSQYFDDAYFQIDYCFAKRKSGTRFYGPSRIIKGKKCYNYVSDRFILE